MKIRTIFLSTIAAMFCVSLQAAEKIAPAKAAWAGPQIETKTKAAVAATALTKKTDLVRALEVMYGAEFDEQEQRLKPAVFDGVKVDETTQTCEKTTYTPQPLPKPLVKIISDYVPEFHYFTPARTFVVPRLAPAQYTLSGTCASFIDKEGARVYIVPIGKQGHFMLFDEHGNERVRCTRHVRELTKVLVLPDETDEKIKQERAYTFVTSSLDGCLKFWDKDGKEVRNLKYNGPISDFDIKPNASINGQEGDLVVIAFYRTPFIDVCHILSTGMIRFPLNCWGNLGAQQIRIVPSKYGFKLVTYEEDMDDTGRAGRTAGLCWYDVALRLREPKINYVDSTAITSMDCISYDKNTIFFLGDKKGNFQGYRIPHAFDFGTFSLKANSLFKTSFGKGIVALKAYKDVTDDECPHVVVKTDDNGLSDMNLCSDTKNIETIISPTKNKHYIGLGSDKNGRTTLLTCVDGAVCEWEKNTNPFNSLDEKEEPKQIRVTPQASDESAENPASCTCIVM